MNEDISPSLRNGLTNIRLAVEDGRIKEAKGYAKQCSDRFVSYVRRLENAILWKYTKEQCDHRNYVINYIQCTALVAFQNIPDYEEISKILSNEFVLASEFGFYHEQGRFANHWDKSTIQGSRNNSAKQLLKRRGTLRT